MPPEPVRPVVAVVDANAFWTEQLFREYGRFADVLLVKPREFRAHRRSSGRWRSDPRARRLTPTVWEQRLSMAPTWLSLLWRSSARRISAAIRRFAQGRPVVLVVTFPQYRRLVRDVKPQTALYYNYDDYRDNWPRHRDAIPEWEAELVETADLIVCISDYRARHLREAHPLKAARIHHVPLGCTPAFMSEPGKASFSPVPPVLAGIPRPLAGHIGTLGARFDFALFAEAARRLPRVSFILGGAPPTGREGPPAWRVGLDAARRLPNVHFIGWVEHSRLGAYLRAFDILLMCYADCDFNRNASPAKLWDYMGTGRPIVANAANPETLLWSELVHIASAPEEYAAAIERALGPEPANVAARRLEAAREHTWDRLSGQIEALVSAGGKSA
jgi:glycosyltransferase involved in cell wall biosynthesis